MFSNLFPPVPTGSSRVTAELARHLAELGHRVVVVTGRYGSEPERETMFGVEVIRLNAVRLPRLAIAHNFRWLGFISTPRNLLTIHRLFAEERFDVVHSHNHLFDSAAVALLMARWFKLPLVLTLHIIVQHTVPVYAAMLGFLDRTVGRMLIVRRADVVISVDEQMRKYIASRFGVSQSPLIPFGITPVPRDREGGRRIRAQYGLGDGPVVLSLGHVHALRDRHELIHAMPAVLARHPRTRLLIAGDVASEQPKRWVAELGLEHAVVFTGAVAHEEIPALFGAADIEAHWMKGVASLSIAGMEAMSAGLPIITARFPPGDAPHGLVEGENVFTVFHDDVPAVTEVLLKLIEHQDVRERVGRNAQAYMRDHFSWRSVAQQTAAIYLELVDRFRSKGAA